MPTPQETVDRAKAMLEQTKAEGSKPFAGSSYDTSGATPPPVTPPAEVATPTTPALTPSTTPRYALPTSQDVTASIATDKQNLESQKEKQRVAIMDTINKKYDTQSKELMAQQRAINYNKGQVGAETGFAAKNKVSTAVEGARTSELETALTKLDDTFYERERNLTTDAYTKAQYDFNLYSQLKKQEEEDKKAITESLSTLGKAGNTIEDIKEDPALYENIKASGLSDLQIMATLNENSARPTSFEIIGNKIVGTYYDPRTNSIKTITQDLGFDIPSEASDVSVEKLGDDLVIYDKVNKKIIEQIKGTPTALDLLDQEYKRAQINKLNSEASGTVTDQLYSGLTTPTATAVRSKVTKFTSEPIVQNFATIQDGYTFASSIDTKTTNPADDQALIYSLAKSLDPGSVVREGEYATAQKYAQSWVKAYGKGVEQALLGNGFLSETARENIKKTIEQKYKSSLKNYENIQENYIGSINNLTGRKDGENFLIDYAIEQDQYTEQRGQLQSGEILIERNGEIGAIPEEEFNPQTDNKL